MRLVSTEFDLQPYRMSQNFNIFICFNRIEKFHLVHFRVNTCMRAYGWRKLLGNDEKSIEVHKQNTFSIKG